jgi:hypothetical protein
MLICCTFRASAMVVPLLLLNSVSGFLWAQFQIVEWFPRCSVHYVNMVRFPVLMFHLNEHVNNMCRNRKTFLKWYSVAILLARTEFLHVLVFHEHVYGEHCVTIAFTHFTQGMCEI